MVVGNTETKDFLGRGSKSINREKMKRGVRAKTLKPR